MTDPVHDLITATAPLLVLLPLFTSQRADRVRRLGTEYTKKRHATEEVVLAVLLTLVTAAVLAFAFPTVTAAAGDVDLSAAGGPAAMLLIGWALFAILGVWQLWLAASAFGARRDLD